MSLRAFHIFFISLSTLMGALFGVWCVREYLLGQVGMPILALGVVSLVSTLGLIVYIGRFVERTRRLGWLVLPIALSFIPSEAWSCSVCYGDGDSKLAQAANAGTLFMLIVVGVVLSLFGSLFMYWVRRARRL